MSGVGVNEANGGWALPLSDAAFAPAEVATLSVADSGPAALGVNVTLIVQLAPAAKVAGLTGQVFVCAKSAAFRPVIVMPVTVTGPTPVLVSVAACGCAGRPYLLARESNPHRRRRIQLDRCCCARAAQGDRLRSGCIDHSQCRCFGTNQCRFERHADRAGTGSPGGQSRRQDSAGIRLHKVRSVNATDGDAGD